MISLAQLKPWIPWLKWSLFFLVLIFVIRAGWATWQEADLQQFEVHPASLVFAGVFFFLGWIPAVLFWRELLIRAGHPLPFYPSLRAHFIGHLGKYVPGKALAILLRADLIRPFGVSMVQSSLAAVVETLVSMLTGLLLAIVLLPFVLGSGMMDPELSKLPILGWLSRQSLMIQWGMACGLLAFAFVLAPMVASFLSWLVVKAKPEIVSESKSPVIISSRTLIWGSLKIAMGWFFHGLSLGMVIQGLGLTPFALADLPLYTLAVAAATSIGFFAIFAPGGLGIRELILVGILQLTPSLEPSQSVAVAVVLRAVWFFSEFIFSLVLYLVRMQPEEKPSADPPLSETPT